jgi:hypothetical protein
MRWQNIILQSDKTHKLAISKFQKSAISNVFMKKCRIYYKGDNSFQDHSEPYEFMACLCINLTPNELIIFFSWSMHFDVSMNAIWRDHPSPILEFLHTFIVLI